MNFDYAFYFLFFGTTTPINVLGYEGLKMVNTDRAFELNELRQQELVKNISASLAHLRGDGYTVSLSNPL